MHGIAGEEVDQETLEGAANHSLESEEGEDLDIALSEMRASGVDNGFAVAESGSPSQANEEQCWMVRGNREKRCLQEGTAVAPIRYTNLVSECQCCRELELNQI